MAKITRTRGQWTANVSGMGTLPVMAAEDLRDDMLVQSWFTRNDRDCTLAQKQFDAVVKQLTAGNPERRIRAVVEGPSDDATGAERKVYEFKLEKMNVSRMRGGVVAYNYLLTDAQELAA